ncbi:MAG: endolytic transglycosylase MltG [Patescibacteria group bacterium]|jgi:UPF0755 protein
MKLWVKISLLIIGIIIAIGLSGYLWFINQINAKTTASVTTFEITSGESSADVISRLYSSGIIKSETVALIYQKIYRPKLLAGTFSIPQTYSVKSLFNVLGSPELEQKKLTVKEGWAKEQIADKITEFGLSSFTFLNLAKNSEGKLFPDTYFIGKKTTEESLVTAMTDQYSKETASLNVTKNQLILASIVEREALNDADRGIIAGIYSNRLKINMSMGADPTVQYAKNIDLGLAPVKDGITQWWAPITAADYKSANSLYNTYLHVGLPPAPICNPGIASINAAQNPTPSDDYYFYYDAKSVLITAKTLAERNALLRTYPIH